MKIRRIHTIEISVADILIEKYYDGMTTVEEEKQLHKFLSQDDLPVRFEDDKNIFGYYDTKKHKPTYRIYPFFRWAAVVVVILSIVFSFHLFIDTQPSSYACIDGQKTTDIRKVKSSALVSLSEISSSANEVDNALKNVNIQDLMVQQLNVFSEVNN